MRTVTALTHRCLALELLRMRVAIDLDPEEVGDDAAEYVAEYAALAEELGLEEVMTADERALLSADVGATDPDVADETIVSGLVMEWVLLWALGRMDAPPPTDVLDDPALAEKVEGGQLVADGFEAERLPAMIEAMRPRSVDDLEGELAVYAAIHARDEGAVEATVALLCAAVLSWILDPTMAIDGDFELTVTSFEL